MDASPPRRRSRPPSPPSESTVSSLPPEILEKFVSFLLLREAVRTSAVSRAWRRLWESAPGLHLEWGHGADLSVVDAVLARYSCRVSSFWIHNLRPECFSRADGWIPLLAGKGVQVLRLYFSRGSDVELHEMDASMFTCRELTKLDLIGCDIPAAPPGLAGFPKLTRLQLTGVGFPDTGVRGLESLVAESPLLEVLWLDDLWFPGDDDNLEYEEWVIEAPNLRNLRICSDYDYGWKMRIAELPSIEEVEISFNNYFLDRDFVELFTTFAPVRKLNLKMPLRENALEGLSCSFGNLKSLSIHKLLYVVYHLIYNVLTKKCSKP